MSAAQDRDGLRKDGDLIAKAMAANARIWNDTLVFNLGGTGYHGPARAGNAADLFAGVAQGGNDNTGGAAGAKRVLCKRTGTFAFVLTGGAVTPALDGQPAYAADDSTVTAAAANAVKVGNFVYDDLIAAAGLIRVDVSKGVA